ncbi:MAG TPA: Hsp20/alpha crystallin family protein [Bacteroidetes bacterium]|nr:Hsp20/alpha crystallin family protein [Bacteroidota bacterium]
MKLNALMHVARDTDDIDDDLDFVFNHYYKARRWSIMPAEKGWKPLTDVYETDDEVVIVMDIAGITTQDIKLILIKNILTIHGIRRERHGQRKRHFHKMEIDFGPFERIIELPAPVDPERNNARYVQGFLEIHLPKREEALSGSIEISIS